eukprot:1181431-Rhodomonas_salina.1
MAVDFPRICDSDAARDMCAVTCNARQACHDGSLYRHSQPTPPRKRFRIFERVMHLEPREGEASVICASDGVDVDATLAECRRNAVKANESEEWWSEAEAPYFTEHLFYSQNTGRADVRDCAQLERRLDTAQCRWNASWLPCPCCPPLSLPRALCMPGSEHAAARLACSEPPRRGMAARAAMDCCCCCCCPLALPVFELAVALLCSCMPTLSL